MLQRTLRVGGEGGGGMLQIDLDVDKLTATIET